MTHYLIIFEGGIVSTFIIGLRLLKGCPGVNKPYDHRGQDHYPGLCGFFSHDYKSMYQWRGYTIEGDYTTGSNYTTGCGYTIGSDYTTGNN